MSIISTSLARRRSSCSISGFLGFISWLEIAGFLPQSYEILHFMTNKIVLFINKISWISVVQVGLTCAKFHRAFHRIVAENAGFPGLRTALRLKSKQFRRQASPYSFCNLCIYTILTYIRATIFPPQAITRWHRSVLSMNFSHPDRLRHSCTTFGSGLMRGLILGLALGLATASTALAAEPVAQHNTNALWFENWGDLTNATLKVSAPNGQMTSIESSAGTPVFQLAGTAVADGVYSYELYAATSEKAEIVNQVDNGRGDAASGSQSIPFYLSGAFQVERGVIITPEALTEDGD
jgi:hypothetical protein